MFEATLTAKLKKIFELDRCNFNLPGDAQEQETLFIQVESAQSRIKETRQYCKVTGSIRVFANSDKLPYGYFAKCINKADFDDTKDLFFFDIEENQGTFLNITERTMGFVYFFNSQYDPNVGTLTDLELSVGDE